MNLFLEQYQTVFFIKKSLKVPSLISFKKNNFSGLQLSALGIRQIILILKNNIKTPCLVPLAFNTKRQFLTNKMGLQRELQAQKGMSI